MPGADGMALQRYAVRIKKTSPSGWTSVKNNDRDVKNNHEKCIYTIEFLKGLCYNNYVYLCEKICNAMNKGGQFPGIKFSIMLCLGKISILKQKKAPGITKRTQGKIVAVFLSSAQFIG